VGGRGVRIRFDYLPEIDKNQPLQYSPFLYALFRMPTGAGNLILYSLDRLARLPL
jgi:hypothetical protein